MKIQKSAEDYLEAILRLTEQRGYVRSIDIAAILDVTKPSVSIAMKRLRTEGYITMDEENLIRLTDQGMEIAQKVYGRHRLLKTALMEIGVSEETAEIDACKIEHDISDETEASIRKALVEPQQ